MKSIIFIFFLTLGFTAFAQNGKGVTYKCTYTDTLTKTDPIPDHIIRDVAAQMAQSKDLPDSLIGKIDSALRKAISYAGVPTQLRSRQVVATDDTTTIVLSDEVVSLGLEQNKSYKKMIMIKGRKILAVFDDDNETLPLPPDEERNFKATGKIRGILSYLCEEFVSTDGKVTIWVTIALPSSINPGIRNVDVEGAILSFILEGDGSQLISTIEKIEKGK